MNATQLTSIGRASGMLGASPQEISREVHAIKLTPAMIIDGVALFTEKDIDRLASVITNRRTTKESNG